MTDTGLSSTFIIEDGSDGIEHGFVFESDDVFEEAEEISDFERNALNVARNIRLGNRNAALADAVDLVNALAAEWDAHAYAQL